MVRQLRSNPSARVNTVGSRGYHPKTFAVVLTGTALSKRDVFTRFRFEHEVGLVAGVREDGTVRVFWPRLDVATVEAPADLETGD